MPKDRDKQSHFSFRAQSAQDRQNEILEEAYFEKLLASKKETHFDLKNFNPEAKSSVIPLAKLNQPSVRPDDLELKAFQDAEQIIRELGQGTGPQSPTQSAPSATISAENRDQPPTPAK